MFVFMVAGEPSENAKPAARRVILVGVDDSAEAAAAAHWAVQEATLPIPTSRSYWRRTSR
jgi:hypothetical protein